MFVKQIEKEEALGLAARGVEIQVLAPNTPEPGKWTDYDTDTLESMLDGCLFFRREPASEKAEFENAFDCMAKAATQMAGTIAEEQEEDSNPPQSPVRPPGMWIPVPNGGR